jgi:NAD(P)-dependent dehydrogenase (short-subunit alcohol dehydrogenase family)
MQDMLDKTVVITGGTSGIGEVAADHLAQKGARIVLIARDRHRAASMLKHLKAIAGHTEHAAYYADLSDLAEMTRVGEEIAHGEPRIDVLINNAGAVFTNRQETADGFEKTFALNHLSYFVITNLLLPRLKEAGHARIISTASDAHRAGRIKFDDLQTRGPYSSFGVYGNTKLMNVLFTRELARRLAGTDVTANCFHPGFVATRFADNNPGLLAGAFRFAKNFALSPERGAEPLIWLAASPDAEGASGGYYHKCKRANPAAAALSDDTAKRLWDVSAELTGVGV